MRRLEIFWMKSTDTKHNKIKILERADNFCDILYKDISDDFKGLGTNSSWRWQCWIYCCNPELTSHGGCFDIRSVSSHGIPMCNPCNWHHLLVGLETGDYYFSHIHKVSNLSHCKAVSNVFWRFLARNYIYGLFIPGRIRICLIFVTLCVSCNQVHIWQITGGSTWIMWIWYEGPIFQFCKIRNIPYVDINGTAFTNRNDSCFSR